MVAVGIRRLMSSKVSSLGGGSGAAVCVQEKIRLTGMCSKNAATRNHHNKQPYGKINGK